MYQFTLLPDSGKRLRKAVYLQFIGIACISVVCCGVITMSNTAPLDLNLFRDSSYFIIPCIILAVLYYRDLTKATRTASSFKLTVTDDTITREVDKETTRSIPVGEVRFISKWPDGFYSINGIDMMKPIVVPAGIERKEELEALLATRTGVTIRSQNISWYKVAGLFVAVMASMMGALFAGNKYLGTVLGILFIGAAVYAWSVFQRGKDYERKIRLLSYGILIPAIIVAVRTIWHWTA
jgi:hypothetical protein